MAPECSRVKLRFCFLIPLRGKITQTSLQFAMGKQNSIILGRENLYLKKKKQNRNVLVLFLLL